MRRPQQGATCVVGKSPRKRRAGLQFQPQQRNAEAIKIAILLYNCDHMLSCLNDEYELWLELLMYNELFNHYRATGGTSTNRQLLKNNFIVKQQKHFNKLTTQLKG